MSDIYNLFINQIKSRVNIFNKKKIVFFFFFNGFFFRDPVSIRSNYYNKNFKRLKRIGNIFVFKLWKELLTTIPTGSNPCVHCGLLLSAEFIFRMLFNENLIFKNTVYTDFVTD